MSYEQFLDTTWSFYYELAVRYLRTGLDEGGEAARGAAHTDEPRKVQYIDDLREVW